MKVVIVGGSAGGASVAARLRRLSERADITLFEQSDTLSFATCGSPYYLGGVIKQRDRLNVVPEEEFAGLLNVKVRMRSKVLVVDRVNQRILAFDESRRVIHREHYDKLVLAMGGVARRPEIPGGGLPHVFTLRNAADMDAIQAHIGSRACRKAVVLGAGFVGIEVAENLAHAGVDVTLVDEADQILNAWDREIANIAHEHLLAKGVHVVLTARAAAIGRSSVLLENGVPIAADLVIAALGIQPNHSLARHCHLTLGEHGGIAVNAHMQTSDENIYALGDAVEIRNPLTQHPTPSSLAGAAHKQARVVADHICGRHRSFRGVPHTSIVKVFDLTVAQTGCSEKVLKRHAIEYQKSYIQAPAHAGFYPNAQDLLIKLLFAPGTGRILGAQIAGGSGVDKRIDVLAAAIQFEKTISDLVDLDLAYAPPYSSPKDPVNIAGMVAHNMLHDDYQVVHWDELAQWNANDVSLIDVRTPEEFEVSSLPNAVNIPLSELRGRIREIPRTGMVVVFCQYGKKGYFAHRILKQAGFENVLNISGGRYVVNMAGRDFVRRPRAFPKVPPRPAADPASMAGGTPGAGAPSDRDTASRAIEIDACGLTCPGPILKLSKVMKVASSGEIVRITATDRGFSGDLQTWCERKGHALVELRQQDHLITALLRKA